MNKIIKKQALIPRRATAIVIGTPAVLITVWLLVSLWVNNHEFNPGTWNSLGYYLLIYWFTILATVIIACTSIWGINYGIRSKPQHRYFILIALIPLILTLAYWAIPLIVQSAKESDPDYQRYISSSVCFYRFEESNKMTENEKLYRYALCADERVTQDEVQSLNRFLLAEDTR